MMVQWGIDTDMSTFVDRATALPESAPLSPKKRKRNKGAKNPPKLPINEVGKRYGRWLVLERAPQAGRAKRSTAAWFLCRCECGHERSVGGWMLRAGKSLSCGCLRADVTRERYAATHPCGASAEKRATSVMRRNAAIRGLVWDLDEQVVSVLIRKPCHYCGAQPSAVSRGRNGDFVYNGLDRVDSSQGYLAWNVVTSCFMCNGAKCRLSHVEFLNWISRVYQHSIASSKGAE